MDPQANAAGYYGVRSHACSLRVRGLFPLEGKFIQISKIGSARPAAPDTAVPQPCKCRPPCGQDHACTHRAGLNELLAHPMLLSRAWLTGAEHASRPGQLYTHQAGSITRWEGCTILLQAMSGLLLALAPCRHWPPACCRQGLHSAHGSWMLSNGNGCPVSASGLTCSPPALCFPCSAGLQQVLSAGYSGPLGH